MSENKQTYNGKEIDSGEMVLDGDTQVEYTTEDSETENEQLEKDGYFVECPKCGSYNVKYDYENAIMRCEDSKTETPAICLDCGYVTKEVK